MYCTCCLPCSSLLRVGGYLYGQLYRLLQSIPGPLVNWFHWLDVHTGDDKIILWEAKLVFHFVAVIHSKYCCSNNTSRIFVKIIKLNLQLTLNSMCTVIPHNTSYTTLCSFSVHPHWCFNFEVNKVLFRVSKAYILLVRGYMKIRGID